MALGHSLFLEAIPALELWSLILDRSVKLVIYEDNQATIKILHKGYSSKMRHLTRLHRVDIGSIHETIAQPDVDLIYVESARQSADISLRSYLP